MLSKIFGGSDGQLNVNFGYQCASSKGLLFEDSEDPLSENSGSKAKTLRNNSSFSCLSGAGLSANATLANTNICNGLIGSGILPGLDSPNKFRSMPSSPSLSSLDILSSSFQSTNFNDYASSHSDWSDCDINMLKAASAPSRAESFLNAQEVQMAGGPAGEDRVQAVCSEEDGWLFCAIYDGFNGRDAADFLASTLYENVGYYLKILDFQLRKNCISAANMFCSESFFQFHVEDNCSEEKVPSQAKIVNDVQYAVEQQEAALSEMYRKGVLDSLQQALAQAENDFLCMVEQEMDERPDLVSIGSCVLVVLLHRQNLYTLGLGDSRAVLATMDRNKKNADLQAIQLTDCHSVDNETERERLLSDHPDDPETITCERVKGKLRVTRAFGVGYLKKKKLNDALMGILRVRNLLSPPYISAQPSLNIHTVSRGDCFVIVASDGMFDFFSNEEAVKLVHSYIQANPSGSPAEFLVEQLVLRAAKKAGLSMQELMEIPAGRRRKYHDDVTVIIIFLGSDQRTSTASTSL